MLVAELRLEVQLCGSCPVASVLLPALDGPPDWGGGTARVRFLPQMVLSGHILVSWAWEADPFGEVQACGLGRHS